MEDKEDKPFYSLSYFPTGRPVCQYREGRGNQALFLRTARSGTQYVSGGPPRAGHQGARFSPNGSLHHLTDHLPALTDCFEPRWGPCQTPLPPGRLMNISCNGSCCSFPTYVVQCFTNKVPYEPKGRECYVASFTFYKVRENFLMEWLCSICGFSAKIFYFSGVKLHRKFSNWVLKSAAGLSLLLHWPFMSLTDWFPPMDQLGVLPIPSQHSYSPSWLRGSTTS